MSTSNLKNVDVYPQYDGMSLINIPHTILSHYGIKPFKPTLPKNMTKELKGVSNIVLFLIDGLGMNMFKKAALNNHLFGKITAKNKLLSMTSVFPPSTPTALTSLYTGLTPMEHGIIEWYLYLQKLDSIIKSIPYKKVTNTKINLPNNPNFLYKGETIFGLLAKNGVKSYCFVPEEYKDSVYTKMLMKKATIVPYLDLIDLMKALSNKLKVVRNTYLYVYIPYIDNTSHSYGPDSPETQAEVERLELTIDNEFLKKVNPFIAQETALILTADHGQKPIAPSKTIYLNKHAKIINNLKKSKSGTTIFPSGNPCNVFLSVQEDKIDETISMLRNLLKHKAKVILLNKAAIEKLFGKGITHKDFFNRIGNILILPNGNNTVWYKFDQEEKINLHGHHGGIDYKSMTIPFVISNMSHLT